MTTPVIDRSIATNFFVLLLLLGGCVGRGEPPVPVGPTVSVTHAWGTTAVPLKPTRVVVLDLPFLDAMTALEQPVAGYAGTSRKAVPTYLLRHLKGTEPSFVGERKQPNLEVILSLDPHLIVANPDRHKMIQGPLESIAPTIALTDDSISEVRDMVRVFGGITGRQTQAQRVLTQLDESIKGLRERQAKEPTLMVVGAFEDEFTTWTASSFIGTLLTEVGGRYQFRGPSTASESQTEVAKITVESLKELNPELLFVYGSLARWQGHPIYESLQAVKNGQVHLVDRDLWSRSRGPLAALEVLQIYTEKLAPAPSD